MTFPTWWRESRRPSRAPSGCGPLGSFRGRGRGRGRAGCAEPVSRLQRRRRQQKERSHFTSLSFKLWVFPRREPDHPTCSQGVETPKGSRCTRDSNSTLHTRSVHRGESPNTHTTPSHPLGTYWHCSHQEGSEVMGGPEGRGQGQLARELGRKGALNRGATNSNGGAQGTLAEAGSCFSLQSGRAA